MRPWIVWCNLNAEQSALEKAFGNLAFSITGSMHADVKVDLLHRWLSQERPILITKPSIMGFGVNMQVCADVVFVGLNDSFEQLYQAIRRCWRFGQQRPVNVYMVASSLEGAVVKNLERKEMAYEEMGNRMGEHMREFVRLEVRGDVGKKDATPTIKMEVPTWLKPLR